MPSSWQARAIRTAISPRLAIRTLLNITQPAARNFRFQISDCETSKTQNPKSLMHDHSAIHRQSLAGDIGSGVGGQKTDEVGDILRLAEPAEWDVLQNRLAYRLAEHAGQLGLDITG